MRSYSAKSLFGPELRVATELLLGRVSQGLTQAALAQKAGVTQDYVARLESGKANPTISSVEKVAVVLGMQVRLVEIKKKAPMITYYTDGSCEPNPGDGGFAVIKDMKPAVLGGEPGGGQTTNIRMEGFAIIAALSDADGKDCEIFTDSEFWINVITKWSINWEKAGWKKKGGEIKNLDIVKVVCPLYRASKAKLIWVRGHNLDEGNELADHWANQARERLAKKK